MLQHHGGQLSCRRHEHKALKTRYMSPDGLSVFAAHFLNQIAFFGVNTG